MTTNAPTIGMRFAWAVELLATHLIDHGLPEPVSLSVTTGWEPVTITAQLRCATLPEAAADLLAWANTLSALTIQAWRPPAGNRVHLSIATTLTDPAGSLELDIFAGATNDPAVFADLTPNQRRTVSLGELRGWSAHPTGNRVPEAPEAQR